jgi:hypothetical protein
MQTTKNWALVICDSQHIEQIRPKTKKLLWFMMPATIVSCHVIQENINFKEICF